MNNFKLLLDKQTAIKYGIILKPMLDLKVYE